MRRSIIALGIAAAVFTATACSAGGSAPEQSGTGDSGDAPAIAIGQIVAPGSFDVNGYTAGSTIQYYTAVFDTLLRQNADGTPAPGLASAWEYDDARTTLTLTLQEGVAFTDGAVFDADAAAANLNQFRGSTATDASFVSSITDVQATNPNTVVITLSEPDPTLLSNLAYAAGYVSSPDSWDNPDVATNPVGTGPYVLDVANTVTGSTYVFEKNDDYWDDSVTQFDSVTMNVYDSPAATMNAIQSGEINAALILDVSSLDSIEQAGFTLNSNPGAWQGLLLMDRDGAVAPELADVRVRQAINYAIDREGLLNAVQSGRGAPTTQIFLPATSAYDESLDDFYTYDPDKARELLKAAGYADGFTLTMPSASVLNASMLTLVQQLLSDVGITVQYEDVAATNYITDLLGAKYASAWMQLGGASTWGTANFVATPDGLFNPFHTETPEVTEWLATIKTGDEEAAAAASKELNAYLVEEGWFASFFSADQFFVTDPTLSVTMAAEMPAPFMYMITTAER